MPTTINSFTDLEISLKFRERFVSEALNKHFAVSSPRGVYRGFRLITEGVADDRITVVPDSDKLDHYALAEAGGDYSIAVRRVGGPFDIDLASLVDAGEKTWVIAIFADYVLGTPTTGTIRAYELDPSDEFTIDAEFENLVVLGQVIIPAGGGVPIPSGNVTSSKRRMAWDGKAPEAVQWSPMLRNGNFEWSQESSTFQHASAFWERAVTAGTATWDTGIADPNTGTRSIDFNFTSGPVTGQVCQHLNLPVEAGQLVRFQGFKKSLEADTGGTAEFFLEYKLATGAGSVITTIEIDTSALDGAYIKLDEIVAVPATARVLAKVGFRAAALNYGGGGVKLRVDDVQCWLETNSPLKTSLYEQATGPNQVSDLTFLDPADMAFAGSQAAMLKYDASLGGTGRLTVSDRDTAATGPELFAEKLRLVAGILAGTDISTDGNIQATVDLSAGRSVEIGQEYLDTAVEARQPRVVAATFPGTATEYTLLHDYGQGAEKHTRWYSNFEGDFVIAHNAEWNGTNWIKDVDGEEAHRICISDTLGILNDNQVAGTNTWGDGSWLFLLNLRTVGSTINSYSGAGAALEIGNYGTATGPALAIENTQSTKSLDINHLSAGHVAVDITTAASADAMDVNHSGSGQGIDINHTGTGLAFDIDNSNSGSSMSIGHSTASSVIVISANTSRTADCIDISATNQSGGNLLDIQGRVSDHQAEMHLSHYGRLRVDGNDYNTGSSFQTASSYASLAGDLVQHTSDRAQSTAFNIMRLFVSGGGDPSWRVDGNGKMWADDGVVGTPADYAECVDVVQAKANYNAGDVMVFSGGEKLFDTTTTPSSSMIAGIVSTNPLILGNNSDGCDAYGIDATSGTVDTNDWILLHVNGDPDDTNWNQLEIDGDQTANYPTDSYARIAKTTLLITGSTYDGGNDSTTVSWEGNYFPQYFDSTMGTVLKYGLVERNIVAIAMLGQVPCKCITENGTIVPGDMLVSSSTVGRAMKAGGSPAMGTVIGKAMETLTDTGAGTDTADLLVYVHML
jgi:hypothetical protein